MIDSLRAMAIFAQVAETGSFRAAAKLLGVSASVVSHQVSALEDKLGAPLFYRSTRKVSLTEQGRILLGSAIEMMNAAQEGLARFVDKADAPVGKLVVSIPAVLTSHVILDHLAAFSIKHPAIALSLRFTDVRENLIEAGLDLAIRMGEVSDTSNPKRRLTIEPRYLVATRDYISARGPLSHPGDLNDWDFVHFSPRLSPLILERDDGSTEALVGRVRISVDSSHAMHRLVLAGAGYAALPRAVIEQDIRTGSLVHLLPDWHLKGLPITAVWPSASTRNHLTARLVDFLAEKMTNGQKSDAKQH